MDIGDRTDGRLDIHGIRTIHLHLPMFGVLFTVQRPGKFILLTDTEVKRAAYRRMCLDIPDKITFVRIIERAQCCFVGIPLKIL